MSHAQPTPTATARGSDAGRWLAQRAPLRGSAASVNACPSAQDRAFIALQNAYRPHAGLMRVQRQDAAVRPSSERQPRDIECLVEAGALLGFPWHDALWIPRFQFEGPGPAVATGPQRVVAEWGPGFDAWALASWFVAPNAWLAAHSPIECLGLRLPDVLLAARADRFVATG